MANEFRIKNGAISPNMAVTDNTVSTSTTTGALQVSGGAGIVGNVYASAFYGAATGLTSIPGANVSGAVPSATSATTSTTAGTVTTNAQPNITSVGTLSTLTVSGTFSGSSPTGSITLDVPNSTIAIGRLDNSPSSPCIDFNSSVIPKDYDARIICVEGTSNTGNGILRMIAGQVWIVGNASATSTITGAIRVGGGMGVAGNVYADAFYGPATGLTSIPGANVSGEVLTANTVSNPSQSNITSVGTLTGLTSSGVVSVTNTTVSTSTTTGALKVSGGLGVAGNVYSSAFYGAGTGLTSIPGANVSGTVPAATTSGTVTTASQPNITSVGTLTNLTSSGFIAATNSSGRSVLDANNSALLLGRTDNTASTPYIHFNSGSTSVFYDTRIASTGGSGVTGEGTLQMTAGQVYLIGSTPATSVITGSLRLNGGAGIAGNVYAGAFYGSGTGLTSIPGANVSGAVPTANTVVSSAQPNITSVGSNLTVSSALLLGRTDNVSSTPTVEFNSGSTSTDYDARILCSGGTGSNNGGDLAVTAATFYIGAKFGYRTGMGASVTQLTSRTTSVTIDAPVGRITLVSATTTAGQISTFTINNSYINSTDTIQFSKFSGSGFYIISTKTLSAGSCTVDVYTPIAVSSAEAPAFNFTIIRGTLT